MYLVAVSQLCSKGSVRLKRLLRSFTYEATRHRKGAPETVEVVECMISLVIARDGEQNGLGQCSM